MWVGVLWAGLRVAHVGGSPMWVDRPCGWIAHVGGKFRHGLLEKSPTLSGAPVLHVLCSSGIARYRAIPPDSGHNQPKQGTVLLSSLRGGRQGGEEDPSQHWWQEGEQG